MSLKHGLLGFLSDQEMSGYDLEKLFNSSIGNFWNAKISQVYRDLHDMERMGWVISSEIVQTDRPNKRNFKITDTGQKELENWLLNYNLKKDFIFRIGILMRTYFAAKIPKEKTISLLNRFSIACRNAMDGLKNIDDELKQHCDANSMEMLYTNATLSYGKKYYKMQIDWCTETIENLRNKTYKKEKK